MSEPRRPSLRLAVGLLVVVVGIVQVQALVQTVRAQARLRDRIVQSQRRTVLAAAPRIAQALEAGGEAAFREAAQELQRATLVNEIELLDLEGLRLLDHPGRSPGRHWPGPAELAAITAGNVLTVGPIGDEARLLSYVALRSGAQVRILRISTAVPDLVEDRREGRQAVIGHGVALVFLVLAGALALFPRGAGPPPSAPLALEAYEEAMERLRERGQALTRQHEAERRLLEERIEDREALARAGELTAGIVHEVRNGLATILGYARLLEKEPLTPEGADAARRVREECDTLEGVIRRFMDFVRRETLNLAPVDLRRLLERVAARESRDPSGAEVLVEPHPAADPRVVGDEELLERAFENLVRNARDAAGPGGKVRVRCDTERDVWLVRIADDGPGLSPEAKQALRPFLTTKAGGLGLGLPITLKIVRLHGGSLEMGDNHPRGLVVTVRLPAAGPAA